VTGRRFPAIALAVVAAGCAGPRYARPPLAVPAEFRGDAPSPGQAGVAADALRWRDLIQDEELARLIGEALEHNFDVQTAAARVLEAGAQATAARAAYLPSVDALTGYSNSRAEGFEFSNTRLGGASAWELDFWGRIRNLSGAARANLLATEEARRVVRWQLFGDLAASYFLLRDLDLEIEITRRALKLRGDSLELVRLRVDNGYSSEIELRQAEVLVKTARVALAALELQSEQTENQLAILSGRNPGPIQRGRPLFDQGLTIRIAAGLPSALLNRRPDIRAAEQQLISAHAMVSAARTAYFPTISLTSSGGFASSALLGLFRLPGEWLFNPAANLPIFHAGAVRAGVRAAEARRQESLLNYRKTVQQAFREVADALAARRKLAELRVHQESLVESLREGLELADLAYKEGVVSYLEFLDAERQLLDAQLQVVQTRRQELTNVVALFRALGGGCDQGLPANVPTKNPSSALK
jgi:multidrug efflux system outer membrane protein